MIKFLRTMSIKNKVRTISIFSLVFIIGLSLYINIELYQKELKLINVQKIVNLNHKISLLLHETQKERGISSTFLASKGLKFKDNLISQRELTNKSIEEFKNTVATIPVSNYPQNGKSLLDNVSKELSNIENMRKNIDNFQIESKKVISYYTDLNSSLLSFIALTSTVADSETSIKNIIAYYNFLMAKERVGIERAIGANAFAMKTFAPGMYAKYLGLINEQKIFFDAFFMYAGENQTFFNEKVDNPVMIEVQKMREVLLSYGDNKDIVFDIDSTLWFDKVTQKINILKQIDDYLAKNNEAQIEEEVSAGKTLMISMTLLNIIFIIVNIFFISFFNSTISR